MIIKEKPVRTRGNLQRLISHLLEGDENEEVHLLRGTIPDLKDAVADARRIGREYAIRHWILAPGRDVTPDQLLSSVDVLGCEFGFDPAHTVIVKHVKNRAVESAFPQHLHVLVAAADPVTGKNISLSHHYQRNEKLSRIMEFEWNHPFTKGAHLVATLTALRRDGRDDIATALEAAFPEATTRPREAFSSADQQRLKREGFDLPALRLIISEAWTETTTDKEFIAKLADHSLAVRHGDKASTYVVETADGTFIGALHRLIRLRKEAVVKRMEEPNARQDQAHDRGSDLSQHSVNPEAPTTDNGGGGTSAEPDRTERGRNAPEGPLRRRPTIIASG
jgi:hypothetical protein